MNAYEGCSGICDENGNLLFYTNGDTVWNKQHQYMKNGITPINYFRYDAAQSSVVIKKPGSSNLYYIFCSQPYQSPDQMLRYWIIDMSKDNGNGEAVVVNEPLLPGVLENIAITRHANGKDLWVGAREENKGRFNTVRTIDGTLDTNIVTSIIGTDLGGVYSSKFSPDANFFSGHRTFVSLNKYAFYVYHFNHSTGKLTDRLEINTADGVFANSEFSHDSRYLYVLYSNKNMIVQYDLSSWTKNDIEQSATIIYRGGPGISFSGIQLAPDRKIYVFNNYSSFISVIDAPYKKGLDCRFLPDIINLSPRVNNIGAPYYPSCMFRTLQLLLDDKLILCEKDSAILDVKLPAAAKVFWNTGDTTQTIVCKQPGLYWVMATLDGDTTVDTIEVKIGPKTKVYIGSDTAFCDKFSHVIDAGEGKSSYQWSTGDTTYSILVDKPGLYAVTVKDSNACANADTILVDQLLPPNLSMTLDTINCKTVRIQATSKTTGINYVWSTGDTTEFITVDKKGVYTLVARNSFCEIAQSIHVNRLPSPVVELGVDTSFCQTNLITLTSQEGENFRWNTGEQTRSINVSEVGQYWVTAVSNNCSETDTITITDGCDMQYFIPNAFTPTSDAVNDVFKVSCKNIESLRIQIYNRWGEKLFDETGLDVSWDGKFSGMICPQDVYCYTITIVGKEKGKSIEKYVTGNVSLLR